MKHNPYFALSRSLLTHEQKRGSYHVLKEKEKWESKGIDPMPFMEKAAGLRFVNTSDFTLKGVLDDPGNLTENLSVYINAFSPAARDIFGHFRFAEQTDRLAKANLLYLVLEKFISFDLSDKAVDNHQMGQVFEELIRKFSEASNETAGEHFTPHDVCIGAFRGFFAFRQTP